MPTNQQLIDNKARELYLNLLDYQEIFNLTDTEILEIIDKTREGFT